MADSSLATYSPIDVTIVLEQNGFSHVITGVSEDTIVMIDRADAWSESVGAYGNTTRIYNPVWDKADITIPLQQTSESNDVLNALFTNVIRNISSENLFSITVKDTAGRSLHYGYEAYVARKPSATYGAGMNTREWMIRVNKLEDTLGGNSKMGQDTAQTVVNFGGDPIAARWIRNA